VVDCSIEHLIDTVFKGMGGALMHISQHQHLNLIPRSVFRVGAIPNEYFPVLSAEISKGNSDGKVSES